MGPVKELNQTVNLVIGIKMHVGVNPLGHAFSCFIFGRYHDTSPAASYQVVQHFEADSL